MMQKLQAQIKAYPALWIAVLVSLICALILIGIRLHSEVNNRNVSVIMSYVHIAQMADEKGVEDSDYLEAFADMGVAAITLSPDIDGHYNKEQAAAVRAAGMDLILTDAGSLTIEQYNEAREQLDANYPLYIGHILPIWYEEAAESFAEQGISVGLVEDKGQYGHTRILYFKDNSKVVDMTRVFRLIPSFAERYAVLNYEGPEEIENIFYRAATDRNIRVLIMTPFYHSKTGEMITDPADYEQVLDGLAERIAAQGLTLGTEFSSVQYYRPFVPLIIFLGVGELALGILLLMTLIPLRKRTVNILLAVALAVCVLGELFTPFYAQTGLAFGAAVFFPCLAIYGVIVFLKSRPFTSSYLRILGIALVALAIGVFVALLGGLYIGANLSNSKYMLEISTFRGVKVSQMIPLLYAVWILYRQLYYEKGSTLLKQAHTFFYEINRRERIVLIVVLILMLAAVCLYILRTGDRIIQAGDLEQRFRIFLEEVLIVRPRTKEFLIAWPALFIAAFFMAIKCKRYAWPFLFAATIGCASVTNTFCHIRAPYLLSLLRTFTGVGFGLLLGILTLTVFFLLWRLIRHKASDAHQSVDKV